MIQIQFKIGQTPCQSHYTKSLMQLWLAFHELVTTAVLEEDREAAVHALMADPLTAAVCSLREIRALFDEMAATQSDDLPAFLNPDAAKKVN